MGLVERTWGQPHQVSIQAAGAAIGAALIQQQQQEGRHSSSSNRDGTAAEAIAGSRV